MATGDYDVESLAAYLHLMPDQVRRLADRGKIPGRKVAGQWRFSQAEIHHWLEERIGAADEQELGRLESSFERQTRLEDHTYTLAELMPPEAVAVPLRASTRASVMVEMTNLAAQTGWLWDAAAMAEAVRAREDLYPTAMETGVALLHPRRPRPDLLAQPLVAFGRTDTGIPFAPQRGLLADLFFLICSVTDRGHLHTLARLGRVLSDPETLRALREAPDAAAARSILLEREKDIAV